MINEWLSAMYDREIAEVEGAMANEHIWMNGSQTEEEYTMHSTNYHELEKYRFVLKVLKQKAKEM